MDPAHRPPVDDSYTKLFVSDLPATVTSDGLREYFSKFGELGEVTVKHGGEARAHYGFVWTVSQSTAMAIMSTSHTIGDQIIPAPVLARNRRRAATGGRKWESAQPADPRCSPDKIFVGGLSNDTTPEDYRAYFEKFGTIKDAIIMRDRATNRSRGFGFVTFVDSASVTAVLAEQYHELDGRKVEVKPALPKEFLADDDSTSAAGTLYGRAYNEPGYMETAMGYMPHLGMPFAGMMPPGGGPPLPQNSGPTTQGVRVTEEGEEKREAADNDPLSSSMEGMSLSGKGGQPPAPAPAAASSQAGQWSAAGTPAMGGMSNMPAHSFVQMPPHNFGAYPPPPALGMVPMPGGLPTMGMMPMMGAPHPVMMVGMPVGGPVAYAPSGPAGPYQNQIGYMMPPPKGRNGGKRY